MKVILKTKDGFEKKLEYDKFNPIIEQVVYTTPEGTCHSHEVASLHTVEKRHFVFVEEERIFHYKEI